MNMTDETVSAFLDNALSDAEMAQVRDAIAQDPILAARVEAFAVVDERLRETYRAIDQTPLPASVQALLKTRAQETEREPSAMVKSPAGDNVVALHGKPKKMSWSQMAQGLAAVFAVFAVGFGAAIGLGSFSEQKTPEFDGAIAYQDVLSRALSGQPVLVENGATLTVQLTFQHMDGRPCRYYSVRGGASGVDSIACISHGLWQLEARQPAAHLPSQDYQAASGGSGLESVLDSIVKGDIHTLQQERDFIEQGWHLR